MAAWRDSALGQRAAAGWAAALAAAGAHLAQRGLGAVLDDGGVYHVVNAGIGINLERLRQ